MALVVDGGGLVNKGGALGTGEACCCNKCSGPCDTENPCPEGCECVEGQCTGEAAGVCCVPVCSECRACFFLWDGTDFVFQNEILNGDCGNCPECSTVDINDPAFGVPVDERIVGQSYPFPACCLDEPIPKTCVEFLNSNDKVTRAQCEAHSSYGASGVWHPGQTCAEEPCVTCEDFPLLGDEAYVDAYCENAASTVDFHGGQCVGQMAICGARTLVNDYGGGFGDWIVNICCANPLP